MADLTDTAVNLLGLVIVAGVAKKVLDEPRKHKKRKEEKPFKW